MKDMIARYQTKIMVTETGYLYNRPKDANNFLIDLIEKTKSVGGLGVFYWEPERYNNDNPGSGYQLGDWYPVTKKPTTAMDAFLGIEDISVTTSMKNNVYETINIYPNPLNNKQNFIIDLKKIEGETLIDILDVSGQKIYETVAMDHKNIIANNFEFRPGFYFVQIINRKQ